MDNQKTDKTHETRHSILGNKGQWSLMGNKEGEPYLEIVSRPCCRKGNPGKEWWTPWVEGAENLEENKTARVLRTGYQRGENCTPRETQRPVEGSSQVFSRLLISECMWERTWGQGKYPKEWEVTMTSDHAEVGIVSVPTSQIGKLHDSQGTG